MQLTHTHYLLGIYDFTGSEASYTRRMAAWLARAGSSPANKQIALMCHPATSSDQFNASDPIRQARIIEFSVLGSELLPALLRRYGLQLTGIDSSRRLVV